MRLALIFQEIILIVKRFLKGLVKELITALLRNPPNENSLSDLVPEIEKAKDFNQEHPVHNLSIPLR